jgi:hypothetical protein
MRRRANGGLIAIADYDASERHVASRGAQGDQELHSGLAFRRWRIDPCGGRLGGRDGHFFHKALWISPKRLIKGELAGGVNSVERAVMHPIQDHEADLGMMMVPAVPIEEAAAEASGVLEAAEAFWRPRLIFQRLDVTFGRTGYRWRRAVGYANG